MNRSPEIVLQTHQLGVTYRRGTVWGSGTSVQALHGIDLQIVSGEIVGIVGPSGSGKSTLARCLALREPPGHGRIEVLGVDAWRLPPKRWSMLRPNVQLVDQSPAAALDPRFNVEQALAQPLRHRAARPDVQPIDPATRTDRIRRLLRSVDLDPDMAQRPCHALSGGQKQRLVIARALAAEPRVLLFDEPLAALDAHQHQRLLQLLKDLHRHHDLTYVWISHDLHTLANFVQRILVLDRGQVVERGASHQLWTDPQHAVSRALVEASRHSTPQAIPPGDVP